MIPLESFKARYTYDPVRDKVGEGGHAIIYKAHDTKLDRKVALKLFKMATDEKNGLVSEIKKAIRLNHRNILRYFDICEIDPVGDRNPDDCLEIGVMEFADGGDLAKYVKQGITVQEKKRLAVEIMVGLRYLHEHRFVHRDLKPENILLANEGGKLTAKIADFGLSRFHNAKITSNTSIAGTLAYQAPEQLEPGRFAGSGRYEMNMDLWALGIILFEMFTGTHPFGAHEGGLTYGEVSRKIMEAKIPAFFNALVPEPFQGIIRQCLVANPIERVQSIDELFFILNRSRPDGSKLYNKKPSSKSGRQQAQSRASAKSDDKPNQPKPPRGKKPTPQRKERYVQCPKCKNETAESRSRCGTCGFILSGPIELNSYKGTVGTALMFILLSIASVVTGIFLSLIYRLEYLAEPIAKAEFLIQNPGLAGRFRNGEQPKLMETLSMFSLAPFNLQELIPIILVLGAVIYFIYWANKAHYNVQRVFLAKGLEYNRFVATLLFLIPIVNIFVVSRYLNELWRGSNPVYPKPESQDWKKSHRSTLIGFWKFMMILFSSALVFFALEFWQATEFLTLQTQVWVIIGGLIAGTVASFMLYMIMFRIAYRQSRKFSEMMKLKPEKFIPTRPSK